MEKDMLKILVLMCALLISFESKCDSIFVFYKGEKYLYIETDSNKVLKGNINIREIEGKDFSITNIGNNKFIMSVLGDLNLVENRYFYAIEYDIKENKFILKGSLVLKGMYGSTRYYKGNFLISLEEMTKEGFQINTYIIDPTNMRQKAKIENPIFSIGELDFYNNSIVALKDDTIYKYDVISNRILSQIYYGDFLKGKGRCDLMGKSEKILFYGCLFSDPTDKKFPYNPKFLFWDIEEQKIIGEFALTKVKDQYFKSYNELWFKDNYVILEELEMSYNELDKVEPYVEKTGKYLLINTNGAKIEKEFEMKEEFEKIDIGDKIGFLRKNFLEILDPQNSQNTYKIQLDDNFLGVKDYKTKFSILTKDYLKIYDKISYKNLYNIKLENTNQIKVIFIQ
jgi:hypothetical protein